MFQGSAVEDGGASLHCNLKVAVKIILDLHLPKTSGKIHLALCLQPPARICPLVGEVVANLVGMSKLLPSALSELWLGNKSSFIVVKLETLIVSSHWLFEHWLIETLSFFRCECSIAL